MKFPILKCRFLFSCFLLTACVGAIPKQDLVPSPSDLKDIPLTIAAQKAESDGETYFDPNNSRIPLYDTNGHKNVDLGPFFRVKDFSKTGDVGFRYARIDPAIVNCLSRVRESLNKPVIILSSYRSWEYNNQLVREGKTASKTSYHMSGNAADIAIPNVTVQSFVKTVYSRCGCGVGIGVADSWFHVDTRGYSTKPWGYGTSSNFRRNTARNIHSKMCGAGKSDSNESVTNLVNSIGDTFKKIGEKLRENF